jgi:hypothetical protein
MKIMRRLASAFVVLSLLTPSVAQPLDPGEFVQYATVRLTADLSHLSANEKAAVKEMLAAAEIMDQLFWRQAYGDPAGLKARGIVCKEIDPLSPGWVRSLWAPSFTRPT